MVETLVHRSWGLADGLPGATVSALALDDAGFLWVGTPEGLARFDGRRFRAVEGLLERAGSSMVTALLPLAGGDVLVGTGSGVARLRGGRLEQFATDLEVDGAWVRSLLADAAGTVWIATDEGLYRHFQGRTEAIAIEELRNTGTTALLDAGAGRLLVGTQRSGALLLTTDRKPRLLARTPVTAGLQIRALAVDAEERLWLASDQGVSCLTAGDLAPCESGTMIPGYATALYEQGATIWFATTSLGLARIRNGAAERVDEVTGVVRTLLADRTGSLWVGGKGLHRLSKSPLLTVTAADGLKSELLSSVAEDANGYIWVGSGAGVARLSGEGVEWFGVADGLPHEAVVALLPRRNGEVWASTKGGLSVFSGGHWQPRERPIDAGGFSALHEDDDGTLWLGGASLLGAIAPGSVAFAPVASFDGKLVSSLRRDLERQLWVGMLGGGLLRLGGTERNTILARLMPDDRVSALELDSAGTLWIGTMDGGMVRYRKGRLTRFTTRNGLPSDMIRSMVADDLGNLWVCSARGLFRVATASLDDVARGASASVEAMTLGAAEGAPEGPCFADFQPGAWKDRLGRIWFATTEGLVGVDPSAMRNQPSPAVVIDRVTADGRPIAVSTHEGVVIPPGSKQIAIELAALHLHAAHALKFRYRLEGFDSEWIDAGSTTAAIYTSPPPGRYTLRIRARIGNLFASETERAVVIHVLPLFHQRQETRLLALAALTTILYLLHRMWVRHLSRRAERLEEVVALRTTELQELNQQLAELATRDGLTGLANRRSLDAALAAEWARQVRSNGWMSIALLDVDHFKAFNDSLGHQMGDDCLRRVAAALADCVGRAPDLAARYGGEEFALLLGDTEPRGAGIVAEQARRAIEGNAIAHPASGVGPYVTISLGVASCLPSEGGSVELLIAAADAALYQAKRSGRNRVVLRELEGHLRRKAG